MVLVIDNYDSFTYNLVQYLGELGATVRVRRNNEDAFHMDAERGIFLVVDGIGGQAAGEKAAEIAVDRVRARLEKAEGLSLMITVRGSRMMKRRNHSTSD